MEPLAVAQRAFAARHGTVKELYFRGDSACHESALVNWLRDEQREGGPRGPIGFAISDLAVLSNLWKWKATRLIEWHREKAGTVELVHDVIKNELGGGVLPSKYFGANAAWLRLAVIAHNVLAALRRLTLPPELLTARPKRLRFLIFNTRGRLVHHARRLLLRLAALAEWITAYREGLRLLPLPS
jgi:hypothetical protein